MSEFIGISGIDRFSRHSPVWFVVLVAVGLFPPVALPASPAPLPQTGQASCYSPEGVFVACAGTGQDGEIRAGVVWPNPRFTVSGDCVTDNLTGLMWTKRNYSRNGIFSATWQQALSVAEGLELCGFSDWRLPNVNEMESLYHADRGFNEAWLREQGFEVTVPDANDFLNWTSTVVNYNPDQVWAVDIYNGLVSPHSTLPWRDTSYNVMYPTTMSFWPVRGTSTGPAPVARTGQVTSVAAGDDGQWQAGIAWPNPRFTVSSDCVTDNLTGLMWARDAYLAGRPMSWEDALAHVSELNDNALCGQTGWRLPNRKELRSLVNYSVTFDSWLTSQGFTNIKSGYGEWTPGSWWTARYWTSTTILGGGWWNPVMANTVGFVAGELDYDLKFDRLQFVWPVRTAALPATTTTYTLSITRAGRGKGTVSSSPAGISCSPDCTEIYNSGTVVTLTATPAAGSVFAGWSGNADCADGVVTLDASKSCRATFNRQRRWR